MAQRTWQPIKAQYCSRAGDEVQLEVEVVYPAEYLPDQEPRVLAHRCSHAMICNLEKQASCIWAGTNPAYDPFTEKA